MTEAGNVEHQCNPYAKALLIGICVVVMLSIIVYFTPAANFFRIYLAYSIPLILVCAVVVAVTLYRRGKNPVPFLVLTGGLIFVVGGVVLDVVATIIKSPTLTDEANRVARALLDSGHSIKFVYIWGAVCQALFALLVCVLWATFLKHRLTLLSSAINSQPKSRLQFIKAATGGAGLSWRQFLLPFKFSDFPKSYHVICSFGAILTGGMLYRWHLGLSWVGLRITSDAVALITSMILSIAGFLFWLWVQYPAYSKNTPRTSI